MLVTAVEARPLRSLDAGRGSSSAPGSSAWSGPTAPARRTSLEALYFALTGRSFRTSRPARPDPVRRRRWPGPRRGARRGRDRAHAARLGQPRRGPPPPARRQPGRPGDARPQPPARSPSSRPTGWPDQGPAGRAPRPPRRLRRRPLAGAGGAAPALRPGAGAAQRPARRLAPGSAAPARARRLGRARSPRPRRR